MSAEINVPQLRFKEFSGEWEEQKLGEQCFSISSGKSKTQENGKYNLYGSTGIIGLTKEFTHDGSYILVARVGANAGFINLVNGKFGVTDNTLVLDLNNEQNIVKFILPLLHKNNLNRLIFGSGQPLVTGGQLKSLKLHFPSKQEQEKIAFFLSSIDIKIEQLTSKDKLLQAYKKGVMQKIFSQEIRFKNDDGNIYPEWVEKRLGVIATRVIVKNRGSSINNVLTNSAIQGIVDQQEYFDKDIANKNNLEGYYIVETDAFVYNPRISKYAPVGPIKRNHLSVGVMSPLYTVFTFKDVNLDYMEAYFSTTNWHRYMCSIANYGARHDRMNITNHDFLKMPILLPSEEEQTKIANFLSLVDAKIEQTQKQLVSTKEFKKSLLQQMFV